MVLLWGSRTAGASSVAFGLVTPLATSGFVLLGASFPVRMYSLCTHVHAVILQQTCVATSKKTPAGK